MKNQALFSSKDKSKKLKCRLLQFLFGASRVKPVSLFEIILILFYLLTGRLTRKSEVLGLIPGLATYFRFSFR